jgi:ribosome-binding protein aMBF1 (putative translation factor)
MTWDVEYTEEFGARWNSPIICNNFGWRERSMARKFTELRSRMSPKARAAAADKAKAMLEEMPLHELRQARGLSQKMLADVLHVQQPSIAKMEKRTDMYLSTLRSHIEAMGGELEVIARFPDGSVKISNFSELET